MAEKIKYRKLYALNAGRGKHTFSIPLRDSIRIGKRNYPITLRADEKHGTYILWKNRKYPVEVVRSRQNRYEILFNDVGYTFTIETPFSLKRRVFLSSSVQGKGTEYIKAPMPGKIIDVPARENGQVSRGEAVVILEAMKMQNEVRSPFSGVVKSLMSYEGEIISAKDALMVVEPDDK
jgi:biotin carboxyl carrier protein